MIPSNSSLSIKNRDVLELSIILANAKITAYGYIKAPYDIHEKIDYFKFAQLIIEDY